MGKTTMGTKLPPKTGAKDADGGRAIKLALLRRNLFFSKMD